MRRSVRNWWRRFQPLDVQRKRKSAPLRLELFSLDQLESHAKALAAKHEVGSGPGDDRLLSKLASNEKLLVEAYDRLSSTVHAKIPISPAGEWLLDNFHLIEEQIRIARRHLPSGYSRQLPHLTNTLSAGYPRVYDIALEVIAHVDGRVDKENITSFVAAYQQLTPLKLGEFWAIPIMLRLALIDNLTRVASRVIIGMSDREKANHWADLLLEAAEREPKNLILVAADMARSNPPISKAFVAELVRRLHGQGPALDIPLTWIEQQLSEKGESTQRTVQLESQQQAANQVSVGASIGSLRFLGAMDWSEFVESLSTVELQLREDPAGIYAKMDFVTRDRYRHVVESIAKQSGLSEWRVAGEAEALARARALDPASESRTSHVGYYLVDKGRFELEEVTKPRYRWPHFIGALSESARLLIYLGSIGAITVAITSAIVIFLPPSFSGALSFILISLLSLLCASQVGAAMVNWLTTILVKPNLLPRLDFSKGIPADYRTLVAVPCLLGFPKNVESLLDALEVRYLANRDENLHFALLTDFGDAKQAILPGDDVLVELASHGIEALNSRYKGQGSDIFFLFHRPREWNPREGVWMGYERKRGKLEALNALLRDPSTKKAFARIVGDISALSPVKYVITLDTDTQLPRDAARKLVSTMAHPLNQPHFDERLGRVTSGYSILQPRVAVSLPGSRRSLFVRLFGGDPGIDPYTRAVSDVYQDLFLEGSFVGKGIYDVDAFTRALSGALPENLILSHDLLEGCHARSALVSDVLLYEEFPYHYGEDAKRRTRWIRGDWQILLWFLPFAPRLNRKWRANSLSALSKWKVFDNLRRSLVPIATMLLLAVSWMASEGLANPWFLTEAVLAMIFLPPLLTSLAEVTRKPVEFSLKPHLLGVGRTTLRHLMQAGLAVVFLPYEAMISLAAIGRSCFRMFVSRRKLLEWEPSGDPKSIASRGIFGFYRSMAIAPLLALALFAHFFVRRPQDLPLALPFLVLWMLSPAVAYWLSRLLPSREVKLGLEQTSYLRRLSRKTWRFFEVFVGPEDNWLPPDNYQEYPVPIVAHRTSPTNIGLSLLANLAAYDFGYLSGARLVERTRNAFQSMDRMERFRGHFYNWYETKTLKPLPPLYVSTVDSGNLAALLLTLSQGLKEVPDHKMVPPQIRDGLLDTLDVLREATKGRIPLEDFTAELEEPPHTVNEVRGLFERLSRHIATVAPPEDEEARDWLRAFETQVNEGLRDNLSLLNPWFSLGSAVDSLWSAADPGQATRLVKLKSLLAGFDEILSLREAANLGQNLLPLIDEILETQKTDQEWLVELHRVAKDVSNRATEEILAIEYLAQQCVEMATLEYEFLYDRSRNLLSIGYNVSEYRRDTGFYDLLASEARLGSFVAIAQGCLPQEHWFALGRLLTTWNNEATLLSWSGSMFEYLMPLLVMPTFQNTLLDRTYTTAVQRQIAYGKEHGVPWGISESGYNTTDVHLNYQYRAFGVPGLGFKRGLAEDLVITPYASVMSLMVAPKESVANLQRMKREGFEGAYGLYEAIDYTPSRLATGQSSAVVKSFMAHHQGMSFLALAYHLLDRKMQKRFQSDPLFQATELLLHERVPKMATFYPHEPEVAAAQKVVGDSELPLRVIDTPNTPRPEVHLLSNGRYTVMVTNSGGGYSRWKDLAVTRWREDPTCDDWGTFCYLRDVSNGEVWSVTHQPTLKSSSHYEAIFPQARAEFRRRDHGLEMHTEITVSPEDDIELRRFSITNLTSKKRTIEFTSYAEVVLAPHAVDEAHPAFSNLFLQTEIIPDKQTILCTRRPRSAKERTPTMLHLMAVHGAMAGEASYETDRSRFIGRGRSVHDPLVMKSGEPDHLSGQFGSVLDPIVAIRCRIVIEPEQTARVHIVTGIGETRDDALRLMGKYHDRHLADRVFELAWTHRQVVLRQLNVSEADAQLYGRLASSIIYANPLRRAGSSILLKNQRGQSGLWGYGISGDLPIVLLRVGTQGEADLVRQMVQAHGYWRTMGLAVDLVIWNEDDSGYRQNFQDRIMEIIAAGAPIQQIDRPGGIFVRRSEQMSEEDRVLLQTVARAIITDGGGSLADQVERRGRNQPPVSPFVPTKPLPELDALVHVPSDDGLILSNGLGGFSPDGREYIVTTSPDHVTPAPWSNVLANPHFGTVVSESGAAYTWCENAHDFRLTPWENDALTDASGEAFYIRDEETGEFWSPTPLPARADSPYVTRHGFGYSIFELKHRGIVSSLTTLVAIDAPVKMAIIKLKNNSGEPRRLSLTGYCEWVLGELRAKSLMHVISETDPTTSALFVRNHYHSEFGGRVAFFDVSETIRTVTCDRSEFLGRNGRIASPSALHRLNLSGRTGAALDPCAAMQTNLDLAEGEEREVVFILGVARDVDDARTLIRRFGKPMAARHALEEVKKHWDRTLGAVQIKTPDTSVNILANGWLIYQVLACRVWARSGYYQSGGAFGFRDQLQDCMALLHSEPALLREHLLRCAARQFREGDVQHWWHPPSGTGVRTHFSDDYLWLPLATARYVLSIGDTGVLDKRIHFLEGRQVKLDEEAYSDLPAHSDESATLYEHCVRSIQHGMRYGRNGLPLMGCGDWNDGMNLVGEHGKGESVWLAFFLFDVLSQFSRVAILHEDKAFAETCRVQAETLRENIEKNGWDGEWYRRAYFDNGEPLGSAKNSECQIDSIPQSWSVMTGAGQPDRSRMAMEAVDRRLVDRVNGLVKLFDPPFDKSDLNPGYIKGYVPGVRENGGQYTHAAIWSAMAFAALKDSKRAWELLAMINPLNHGSTPAKVGTYKVEPYVVAADVYAVPPHTGRGGWTWYTGSAGWMYRLIMESLLGLRLEVNRLFFEPCVPEAWEGYEIRYRYRETFYDISVHPVRDKGKSTEIIVDGLLQAGNGLLLTDDHATHTVQVFVRW